jgi:hypothetical protein
MACIGGGMTDEEVSLSGSMGSPERSINPLHR